MITNAGMAEIRKVLSGGSGPVVSAIGVGLLDTAATADDKSLGFEYLRVPVVSSSTSGGKIYYKANIPDDLACQIMEIGLWGGYSAEDSSAGVITSFDSKSETWAGGEWAGVNNRIGIDSLRVDNTTAKLSNLSLDTTPFYVTDVLQIAYTAATNSTGTIKFNYEGGALSAQVSFNAGYRVANVPIFDGTPRTITSIELTTTNDIYFDAIRVTREARDMQSVLIARSVTNVKKSVGKPLDIEYSLDTAGGN